MLGKAHNRLYYKGVPLTVRNLKHAGLLHFSTAKNTTAHLRKGRHKCSEDYFALHFSSAAPKKEACPPLAGV